MARKKDEISVKSEIKTNHRGTRSQTATNTNGPVTQNDLSGSYRPRVSNYNGSKPQAQKVAIDEGSNMLTWLGRMLLEFLGIDKFKLAMIISGIGSVLSIILSIFSLDGFKISLQHPVILVLGMGLLFVTFSVFNLYGTRTCPSCNKKFALIETSKLLLGSAKHRYEIHDTIRPTYKCYSCKYIGEREYIDSYEQVPFTSS